MELGAQVTDMHRIRDGDLLVELANGAGSVVAAAQKLSSAIATWSGDAVKRVSQFGQYVVVDIVDQDVLATEDEVNALWAAVAGVDDDQAVIYERQCVQVIGLWPTKSG